MYWITEKLEHDLKQVRAEDKLYRTIPFSEFLRIYWKWKNDSRSLVLKQYVKIYLSLQQGIWPIKVSPLKRNSFNSL